MKKVEKSQFQVEELVPSSPRDRRGSLRGLAWVSLVAACLCVAWVLVIFLVMLTPTSLAVAFDLLRRDKGVLAALAAAPVFLLGGLLTLNRLRRAESWTQLSRVDRVLSVAGILPGALVFYPIAGIAMVMGVAMFFGIFAVGDIPRLWRRRKK